MMMTNTNAPKVISNPLLGPFLCQTEKSSVCAPTDTASTETTISIKRAALIFLSIMPVFLFRYSRLHNNLYICIPLPRESVSRFGNRNKSLQFSSNQDALLSAVIHSCLHLAGPRAPRSDYNALKEL